MTTTTPYPAPSPRRPSAQSNAARTWWIGFELGFALIALASCGGLAMMLGLTDLRLADFQENGPVWSPPAENAQASGAEVGAASADVRTAAKFQAGEQVLNITGSLVNIRISPGHLGKPAGDILAQVQPGDVMEIEGESTTQDNLVWWKVRVQGIEGWVAEATASGVQILGQ